MRTVTEVNTTQRLITYSLLRLFFTDALFGMAAMTIVGLNQLVDGYFAGLLLGPKMFLATSLVFPFNQVVLGIGSWLGAGAAIAISTSVGRGHQRSQRAVVGSVLLLNLALVPGVLLPCAFLGRILLSNLTSDPDVLAGARQFFIASMLGGGAVTLFFSTAKVVRGMGATRVSMALGIIFITLNLVFHPVFIWTFGIAGSAIATATAALICSVLSIIHIRKGVSGPFFAGRRAIKRMCGIVLITGLPSVALQLLQLGQQYLSYSHSKNTGSLKDAEQLASAFRLMAFAVLPATGVSYALQPVIGVNIGARNWGRVFSAFTLFTLLGAAALLVIGLFLYSSAAPALIFADDSSFRASQTNNYRALPLLLPLYSIMFNSITVLQSAGRGNQVIKLIAARFLLVFVPLLTIWPGEMEKNRVFVTYAVSDIISCCALLWVIARLWRTIVIQPAVAIEV